MNFQLHTIYILDDHVFKRVNIDFLSYINRNKELLQEMGVKVKVNSLLLDQLQDPEIEDFLRSNNINQFPILISGNKIHKGLQDIIKLYESNFNAYKAHKIHQMQLAQQERINQIKNMYPEPVQKPVPVQRTEPVQKHEDQKNNDKNNIKDYMDFEIGGGKKKQEIEDDDNVFNMGDSGNMMDNYRNMMERRGGFKSKTKSVTITTTEESIREDNVEIDDSPLNIDPTKIDYDEEKDPQDDLIEQAYWARMSESK